MLTGTLSPARSSRSRSLHATAPRARVGHARAAADVPGRRGLQIGLGLVWLLDAALQYQPFMFTRSFVTQVIQPATAGSPDIVARSATWASHVMIHHITTYNAVFATIQLLIAVGFFFRRTCKAALATSIIWALLVWWFGEALAGILTGPSPLDGVPGAVLYALMAVLLWPAARPSPSRPSSPATSGPLGATVAKLLWLILWGSFTYFLLLPDNRAPSAIGQMISVTDHQPGWVVSIMDDLVRGAGQRGTEISIVAAILCGLVALGIFVPRAIRPTLVVAIALALLLWVAEGFGGIFTGQGTDPDTGPLLVLLAACFWPHLTPHGACVDAASTSPLA